MALPCLKNARRIFAIVSTTSIPTSASKNHGSQCGPSVPGSRLEADHPEKGVLFACRFTGELWHQAEMADVRLLRDAYSVGRGADRGGRTDPGQAEHDGRSRPVHRIV